MDIIEIFLKRYSYRFPKGYVDLDDNKDKVILEGILNKLGLDFDLENRIIEETAERTIKISSQHYRDILKNSGYLIPPDMKKTIEYIINNVAKNNDMATPAQADTLKRFKSGAFNKVREEETEEALPENFEEQ